MHIPCKRIHKKYIIFFPNRFQRGSRRSTITFNKKLTDQSALPRQLSSNIHDMFVDVTAEKASNTIVFVCKSHNQDRKIIVLPILRTVLESCLGKKAFKQ